MQKASIDALKGNYGREVGRLLRPPSGKAKYTALDLYCGGGGLSLGLEAAGFTVTGIDNDSDCCKTYGANLQGACAADTITPQYDFPEADLVAGGVPCQPFSVRGKQLGRMDTRNGMPSFISAIRKTMPKMWIFENVRGMLYRNREYFESSMGILQRLGYRINTDVINCADYGVPQKRERVIAVGYRGGGEYCHPEGLDGGYVTAGEALRGIPAREKEKPRHLTPAMDRYISLYERASHCARPRDLDMRRPARTLTCRNLGGSTSDMHRIVTRNGKRRMLYVREACRLQGFPDWFVFHGGRDSAMAQIGNAVPPMFALAVGLQAKKHLDENF